MSQQCAFVAEKADGILASIASMSRQVILLDGAVSGGLPLVVVASHIVGDIKHSIARQSKEVILLLHVAFMQPHCEYCMRFWAS